MNHVLQKMLKVYMQRILSNLATRTRFWNNFLKIEGRIPMSLLFKFTYECRNLWFIGWHDIKKTYPKKPQLFIININEFFWIYCSKMLMPSSRINTFSSFINAHTCFPYRNTVTINVKSDLFNIYLVMYSTFSAFTSD